MIISRKICIIIFSIIILIPNFSSAKGAKLKDIIVTNTQKDLLVYLKIQGAFTETMQKAVISGVPTTFSFFITLDEVRSLWLNKTIAEVTLTHTIKYNNLKQNFTIHKSWGNNQTLSIKSIDEAQSLMTEIDGYKIISLDKLEKGVKYKIRAKAKLSKMSLPFYFHYILIMASMWDFETEWHFIDFVY